MKIFFLNKSATVSFQSFGKHHHNKEQITKLHECIKYIM